MKATLLFLSVATIVLSGGCSNPARQKEAEIAAIVAELVDFPDDRDPEFYLERRRLLEEQRGRSANPDVNAQIETACQRAARALEAARVRKFEAIFTELNRLARENDLDALRAFWKKQADDRDLQREFVAFCAEAYYSAAIRDAGRRQDRDALAALVDEIAKEAPNDVPTASCVQPCADLTSLFNKELGDELRRRAKETTANAKNNLVAILVASPRLPEIRNAPKFDKSRLDVPKGKDVAFYRARLKELDDEGKRFNNEIRSSKFAGQLPVSDHQIQTARKALLREIVFTSDNRDDDAYRADLRQFVDLVFLNINVDVDSVVELEEKNMLNALDPEEVQSKRIALLNYIFNSPQLNGVASTVKQLDDYKKLMNANVLYALDAPRRYRATRADSPEIADALADAALDAVAKCDDPNLKLKIEILKRELAAERARAKIETVLGKPFNFSGRDLDLQEFSSDSLRGKYVVLHLNPYGVQNDRRLFDQTLDRLVARCDANRFAFVEYRRAIGPNDSDDPRHPTTLQFVKQAERTNRATVVQSFGLYANDVYDASYPALFNDFFVVRDACLVLDPDGVAIAFETQPWRLERRVEILLNSQMPNE